MASREFDLLLFPAVYSYVPVISQTKKVLIIHDVIAETFPQHTLPRLSSRLFWNAKVALGRWQADAIVTISDYSRDQILRHFRVAPERVHVVSLASDPVFRVLDAPRPTARLASFGIGDGGRTVVYVGGFSPHKNLEALVAAFANIASRDGFGDVRLVMVGEYRKEVFHSYFEVIKRQVEDLGIANRVVFTGYLPDEELAILLNLSTVLSLPSLMEGFGLPAVEAAACGCPVVATTASPLSELLGSGALYVDPADPSELEWALRRVLKSEQLQQRMRTAGLAAARSMTWEGAARQMIAIMEKVAAS
jgi:glycosyltransferase involved in cell wall biosynthesis